jgi:hypothetical protein
MTAITCHPSSRPSVPAYEIHTLRILLASRQIFPLFWGGKGEKGILALRHHFPEIDLHIYTPLCQLRSSHEKEQTLGEFEKLAFMGLGGYLIRF